MNSKLYGKKVELPEEVTLYLAQCFDTVKDFADESIEGFKRNKELRDSGYITYQQLKRMKNWFDNFEGENTDKSFILNGADYVKSWINKTLESMRNGANNTENRRDEYLPKNFTNHTKDLETVNDFKDSHKSTEEVFGLKIEQSIKRINQLIKTI